MFLEAFAAQAVNTSEVNPELLSQVNSISQEQILIQSSNEKLQDQLRLINPKTPDKIASYQADPLTYCSTKTGKCYWAVERINTFWGKTKSNQYCQDKYGSYPEAFAKRMRIKAVPTPLNFCWQAERYDPKYDA